MSLPLYQTIICTWAPRSLSLEEGEGVLDERADHHVPLLFFSAGDYSMTSPRAYLSPSSSPLY